MIVPGHILSEFAAPALVSGEPGREYRTIQSRDFAGAWKIIVYWPPAYLLQCTGELHAFAQRNGAVLAQGAAIIGAVPDASWLLASWRSGHPAPAALPFPIISDGSGAFAAQLGLAPHDATSLASAHMIVDPWGRVRISELHQPGACRSVDAMLRQLAALQAQDRAASTRPSKRQQLAASA